VDDLQSTNGTFVNRLPVDRLVLHDADLLQLGDAIFKCELSAGEGSPPTDDPQGGSSPAPMSASVARDRH